VEDDLAAICEAARDAGARWAGTVLLRLPGSVAAVFEERMRQALPHKADKVLSRIRETHGGQLYDPRWLHRQRGDGPYAAAARRLFESTVKRYGLDATLWDEDRPTTFHRPGEQLRFSF
jgi:DNA repair photolyase